MDEFYKGNINKLKKNMTNLDIYERAFLFSIVPYIGYEDCCLKYDNGKEIGFTNLIEISKISKRKVQDIIGSLVEKNILYKEKDGKTIRYFVNPYLFCKGSRIQSRLCSIFENLEEEERK